jgi:hypothetical protein
VAASYEEKDVLAPVFVADIDVTQTAEVANCDLAAGVETSSEPFIR